MRGLPRTLDAPALMILGSRGVPVLFASPQLPELVIEDGALSFEPLLCFAESGVKLIMRLPCPFPVQPIVYPGRGIVDGSGSDERA